MAKTINSWKIIIQGKGETVIGAEVVMGYRTGSSVDGDVRSQQKHHNVPNPSFSKTLTDFVADEISTVKIAEGIS